MQTPRPDRFTYPAEDARQGEIILKRPWMRGVFLAGLAGLVVLGFLVSL